MNSITDHQTGLLLIGELIIDEYTDRMWDDPRNLSLWFELRDKILQLKDHG